MRHWIMVCLFSRWQWYRRLAGGHWEQWNIDWPVCSRLWLDVDGCTVLGFKRPGLAMGTPICEDWGAR